jgi:hypothetical protein
VETAATNQITLSESTATFGSGRAFVIGMAYFPPSSAATLIQAAAMVTSAMLA